MQRQRNRMPVEKSPAQKLAKNISTVAFIMCLIVIGIIFIYSRQKDGKQTADSTSGSSAEVERLASKDLEVAYPETPVEVMKLYGRINQCMYNTELEDDEFDKLLAQLRMLYSTTLLEQNTLEEHTENLKAEISGFEENKRRIVNYTVDKSSSVKYEEIDGRECAYIQIAFFISENSTYSKSFQDYVLVRENGNWKILAFKKNNDQEKENS